MLWTFCAGTDTASQQEFTSCLKDTLRGLAKNADNLQVGTDQVIHYVPCWKTKLFSLSCSRHYDDTLLEIQDNFFVIFFLNDEKEIKSV